MGAGHTGAGGNDPNTGRQKADQKLHRTTLALAMSMRLGLPVRVVRGAHRDVHGSPDSGYRYDGLYRVTDYWPDTGLNGYRVWRFRLEALEGEVHRAMSGRVAEPRDLFGSMGRGLPERQTSTVSRVVRDTAVTREVKRLYDYRCQVCDDRIDTPTGPYAEAAHIRPLGRPHDGPDVLENVLCLCPTHHAAFDYYAFAIADDGALIGLPGVLRVHPHHRLGADHIRYHREHFEAAQNATAQE